MLDPDQFCQEITLHPPQTKLRLSVIGAFQAEGAHGDQLNFRSEKAGCLLAYLALTDKLAVRRDHLCGMLWSESPNDKAQGSLRGVLKVLRDSLDRVDADLLRSDRRSIELSRTETSVDLQDLYESILANDFDRLLEIQFSPDQILSDFSDVDESYDTWLQFLRRSWRDKFVDALEHAISVTPNAMSVKAAQALRTMEPSHEGACRHVIEFHASTDNTVAALRIYNELYEYLAQEFDAEPSPATIDLIASVKLGEFEATPTIHDPDQLRTLPTPDQIALGLAQQESQPALTVPPIEARKAVVAEAGIPRVGVAPFKKNGLWRSDKYLVEGFRSDLIAALVRFREWVVSDTLPDVTDLEASGIDYILEGGYQDNMGVVRMTIMLRGRDSGEYLWSEPLEFGFDQWLQAQNEIVRRISIALNVSVSYHYLRRGASDPSKSNNLYTRWLKGQELLLTWRPDAHAEAKRIFEEIVAEDPNFSRAYSSLAQIANAVPIVSIGLVRNKEEKRSSINLAKRAVATDPFDTRGHLCLAWARMVNRQFELAEIGLEQALQLNANDPWTMVSVALGWAFCGDPDRAKDYAQQALHLGLRPTPSHWGYQALLRYIVGDYEGCIEAAEESEYVFRQVAAWQAASEVQLGRFDDARETSAYLRKTVLENWGAASAPTDAAIVEWILHCGPIKSDRIRTQLRNDLALAGFETQVPVEPV